MKKTATTKGYTIIETMISMAIFLVVVQFGVGSLLSANSAHQKSQELRTIMDSLSFAIDDISRGLRTGYDYQCFRKGVDSTVSPSALGGPRSCDDGWAIAFEADQGNSSSNSDQLVYYIGSGKIWKSVDGAQNFVPLTADEIVMNSVSGFSVLGAESTGASSNRQQPFVTIRFSGTITYRNLTTDFAAQTSVSERLIDI